MPQSTGQQQVLLGLKEMQILIRCINLTPDLDYYFTKKENVILTKVILKLKTKIKMIQLETEVK